MTTNFILSEFWPIIIISVRMIGLFGWMPGFSELYIPFRIRMMLAIGVGLAFSQIVHIPPYPANAPHLTVMLLTEYLTGAFLGLILKICVSALETAGTIMSQSVGLSNALVTNLIDNDQSTILSSFFNLAGIAFIFIFDLHHLILKGVHHSYEFIPIGTFHLLHHKADLSTFSVNESFKSAFKFSMPFFIFGNVVYVGMGLINKLIPQIQIFFLSMPIQILVGLIILMFSMSAILGGFLSYFGTTWTAVIG